MKIIMLGAPGAGKGTQAIKIADRYNIPHISTGDIFRANIRNKTELGKKVSSYIDSGLLVPDDITTALVVDRINQDDCKNGFVLDGFPRTIPQAKCLEDELNRLNLKMDLAINIDVEDQIIINRISGRRACPNCSSVYHIVANKPNVEGKCDKCNEDLIQRADDSVATVEKRLEVYHSQTKPLIEYYQKQGILVDIDGDRSTSEVFDNILEIIGE